MLERKNSDTKNLKSVLMVAHPGHEVIIHNWLEQARPTIFILTDGSGRARKPRIPSTSKYLEANGLKQGCVFGQVTDTSVYKMLLARDHQMFLEMACALAEFLIKENIDQAVGDALEGYNTSHDACRIMLGVAVEIANRNKDRKILNYDFPVINNPKYCPESLREKSLWFQLDDETFTRKIRSASTYYPELMADVVNTLDQLKTDSNSPLLNYSSGVDEYTQPTTLEDYRTECLRPVDNRVGYKEFLNKKPYYELSGAKQVAAGHYTQVIKFREHMQPLFESLWSYVEKHA